MINLQVPPLWSAALWIVATRRPLPRSKSRNSLTEIMEPVGCRALPEGPIQSGAERRIPYALALRQIRIHARPLLQRRENAHLDDFVAELAEMRVG